MSKELFELYLNNLNTSIELIDVIIPTIKTFEGKVYNKRFENDINEVLLQRYGNDRDKTVYFHSTIRPNSVCLVFSFLNYRSLYYPGRWDYLPQGYEQTMILNEYQSGLTPIKYITIDNNKLRLNASLIIEALEEQKFEMRKKIEALKTQALCVDEWRKRLEAVKKEAEVLNNEIPYEIRTIFGIEASAFWR